MSHYVKKNIDGIIQAKRMHKSAAASLNTIKLLSGNIMFPAYE